MAGSDPAAALPGEDLQAGASTPIPGSAAKDVPRARIASIAALSLSHTVNDLYIGALAPILPLLVDKMGLSMAVAGGLGSIQVIAAASQPAFGFLADQWFGRLFIFLGPLMAAIGIGGVGLAPNFSVLVALLILAGAGGSSFHPPAAASANTLSGSRKGLGVSVFLALGSVGRSLGPLLIALIVTTFGLGSTWMMILPVLLVGALWKFVPQPGAREVRLEAKLARRQLRAHFWPLLMLWGIVGLRSVTNINFRTFLPLFLTARGGTLQFAASLISIYFFAGAAGIILGGYLTDRLGPRPVLIGSVLLGAPFFYFTIHGQGPLTVLYVAVAGVSLMSAHSICLVAAQEMIPDQAGTVSGLMMGLALSVGGLSAPLFGWVGDRVGLDWTLNLVIVSLAVTIPIAMAVPFPKRLTVDPAKADVH